MEVICDRCNAEYEFEEALVSTGGTTVKCTNCGHLFKVYRASPTSNRPRNHGHAWTIQYESGRKEQVSTLRDITHRMTAGQLGPADQISRTGRVFRKLGEIEELQHFFPGSPLHAQLRQQGVGGAAAHRGRGRIDSAAIQRVIAGGQGDGDIAQPGEQQRDGGPPLSPDRAPAARHPFLGTQPTVADTGRSRLDADDRLFDGFGDPASTRRRRLRLTIATILVGAGVAALLYWPADEPGSTPAEPLGNEPQEAGSAAIRAAIERGDEVLSSYDLPRFPEAADAYSAALEAHPNDPHLLSSLSRLHAHWSQRLLFELDDLRAGRQPQAGLSAEAISDQQEEQASLAKTYAVRAARKNPGNEESEVALADALRLNGNLVAARAELDRARAGQHQPDGETLRVATLLAIAEDDGDMAAGAALSEQAARHPDCGLACRILRIRVLATVDPSAAKANLRELAQQFPYSPEVAYMRAVFMGRRRTPALEKTSGKPQNAAPTTAREAQGAAMSHKDRNPSASRTASQEPSPRAQLLSLCRRGDRALEEGDVDAAEELFNEAYELRPGSPRVATGKGFIALERGQPGHAAELFRSATAQRYGEAYIGLGLALRQLGKLDEAATTYRAYLQQFPSGRSANIAQSQLAALQQRK